MGWATGSGIAEELWKSIKPYINIKDYGAVSKIIVEKFEEYDADDWVVEYGDDCFYYTYLSLNNPEELKEYDFD